MSAPDLYRMRHSLAHVMAQAVQDLFHREGAAWKVTTERRQTTYRSRHRRI